MPRPGCAHNEDEHVLIRVGNAQEGYIVCPVADCEYAATWSTPRSTKSLAALTKAQIIKKFGALPRGMQS